MPRLREKHAPPTNAAEVTGFRPAQGYAQVCPERRGCGCATQEKSLKFCPATGRPPKSLTSGSEVPMLTSHITYRLRRSKLSQSRRGRTRMSWIPIYPAMPDSIRISGQVEAGKALVLNLKRQSWSDAVCWDGLGSLVQQAHGQCQIYVCPVPANRGTLQDMDHQHVTCRRTWFHCLLRNSVLFKMLF